MFSVFSGSFVQTVELLNSHGNKYSFDVLRRNVFGNFCAFLFHGARGFIKVCSLNFICECICQFQVSIRKYMQGGQFEKDTRIDGKIVIITGANSGIGKETAVDLAKRGGKIYIACRDIKRGEDALKEIKSRSESDQVFFLQLDLASLESVREFSKKFHELESQLHILINNAGVMACPKTSTKDGFELHIGTNHLGHFLLTNLLLDLLKSSQPSRVVTVSSLFHIVGKIRKDDLFGDKFYFRWFAYASSKLANILFTRHLAKKLKGTRVTANCLHPGAVHSDLQRHVNVFIR